MNAILIIIWIWLEMIAMSFWEAYVEGRNAWNKNKLGWEIRFAKNLSLPAYHFYVFCIMFPLLLTLPLIIYGWNLKLFGILVSAYFSGMVIEDFMWFVVNPAVKFKEFWTSFSDYYPWLRFKNKKIIPIGYIIEILISIASWYFIWR